MSATSVYAALGLSRNPFPPTPDAESYFFTPALEEEFAELVHCIDARKGFVLLTGEVGLGKSTLVRRLLASLDVRRFHTALVLNTFLQGEALLGAILADFGLPPAPDMAQGLAALNHFLLQRRAENVTCLLVIDDAQNLTVQSLELARLLCNLETGQEKLLQILLVGQPELDATLAQPELRQLKSRIIKHTRLRGLARDEVARYFDFRINAAGGSGRLTLRPDAADWLHHCTQGNLRQVHLVLDRCLYGLVSQRQQVIDLSLLRRVLAELPEIGPQVPAPGQGTHEGFRRIWRRVGVGAALGLVSMAALATWQFWQLASEPHELAEKIIAKEAPERAEAPAPVPQTEPQSLPPPPEVLTPRQACEQKLKTRAGTLPLQAKPLGASVAPRVSALDTVCAFEDNQVPWLMWIDTGRSTQIDQADRTVRALQTMLRAAGYLDAAVDGMLGTVTRQALARFQQQQGLAPTGQVDELSIYLLENQHAFAR
jgi:general secretion pathway protein A